MLKASELSNFYGSEEYYRHKLSGLIYTEGVQFIAENGGTSGAYWLLDLIGSYQHKLKDEEFQLWTLKVDTTNRKGVVTCQSDSGRPDLVRQVLEYTDFDLPELKLYVENGTICLPSER